MKQNISGKNSQELWAVPFEKVFSYLKSSESGLTDEEALNRLKTYGINEITSKGKRGGLIIFLSQFQNFFILILAAATILSFFFGEGVNATIIFVMILITVLFGFFQEYKAERTIQKLRKYIKIKARVLRNGRIKIIDSKELVPGDIIYLDIGDIVPADLRLIKIKELSMNESVLTGESVSVEKKISLISSKLKMPQELINMAFMGTSVSSGTGYGIVTATGQETFFGRTAVYVKEEDESDFQKNIKKFSRFILKVIVIMTLFVFLVNAIFGRGILDSFLFALALAIGITPEILPIIMTVALSRGAIKMAEKKVVVKRLASIEDLGNVDVLCCDKTGTLTEGELSLRHYVNLNEKSENKLLLYGLLCSSVIGKGENFGRDQIDNAIWQNEEAHILKKELKNYNILGENELDFERRRMSVLVQNSSGKKIIIAKGAAESILKASKYATFNGRKILLTKRTIEKITDQIIKYEKSGHKLIAIAEKQFSKNETSKSDEKELNFLGFLLFIDPPKNTVKEALIMYQKLGVEIKILSGDSPIITKRICQEVGLGIYHNRVIIGDELEKLNDEELGEYAEKYNVFSRISPEQKYKIVKILNKNNHIVGYLGDGINDAPALKAADVGISVDSGAEISKDASDIILLQKNLHVIAQGITEGRKTFGNIMKYILNTMSSNYGNIFTVASSSMFLNFIPLLPSQILLSNLLSDVPDLTISTDNVDEEMLKKPKKWNIELISKFVIYFGLLSSFCNLVLIFILLVIFKTPINLFRTALFVEIIISQITVLFAIRTKKTFFKSRPSWLLLITTLIVALGTIIIPFTIFGENFFGFVKLPVSILITIIIVLTAYFTAVEIAKKYFFKKFEI